MYCRDQLINKNITLVPSLNCVLFGDVMCTEAQPPPPFRMTASHVQLLGRSGCCSFTDAATPGIVLPKGSFSAQDYGPFWGQLTSKTRSLVGYKGLSPLPLA